MTTSSPSKLFVGGLCPTTSDDSLRSYFSQFGEVIQASVMRDQIHTPGPEGPRSRGFGFVLFSSDESIQKVLEKEDHVLDGKAVDPKKAMARGEAPPPRRTTTSQLTRLQRKVFCGGLGSDISEQELRQFFSTFGDVESVSIVLDASTHRSRGFGFVIFDSEDVANSVCEQQYYDIKSKRIEVKKAVAKNGPSSGSSLPTTSASPQMNLNAPFVVPYPGMHQQNALLLGSTLVSPYPAGPAGVYSVQLAQPPIAPVSVMTDQLAQRLQINDQTSVSPTFNPYDPAYYTFASPVYDPNLPYPQMAFNTPVLAAPILDPAYGAPRPRARPAPVHVHPINGTLVVTPKAPISEPPRQIPAKSSA